MDRRLVLLGLAASPLAACETLDPAILDGIVNGTGGLGGALTAAEVALGLKAALDNGVGNALSNVGVLNGFLGNNTVRIRGPDTAATEYLRGQTSNSLAQLFAPIMESALNQTGALRLVDDVAAQMGSVPFAPSLGANARNDLIEHGVDYGLKGVFHFIGEEEKAIRANPAKRTSDILRRVFGA